MGLHDALPACRFYVQVDRMMGAMFAEVSGLEVETVVDDVEEGGVNDFVHRLPGRTKVGTLKLKRGVTLTNEFYFWYLGILKGKILRRTISIVMYNVGGGEIHRWSFANAYPVKWTGPQFSADGQMNAVETIELAHDGLIQSDAAASAALGAGVALAS